MFDEQPDGDPHGECAMEIKRLNDALEASETKVAMQQGLIDGFVEMQKQFNMAVNFAISQGIGSGVDFLTAWREGDTSEWPEFTTADPKS